MGVGKEGKHWQCHLSRGRSADPIDYRIDGTTIGVDQIYPLIAGMNQIIIEPITSILQSIASILKTIELILESILESVLKSILKSILESVLISIFESILERIQSILGPTWAAMQLPRRLLRRPPCRPQTESSHAT